MVDTYLTDDNNNNNNNNNNINNVNLKKHTLLNSSQIEN